MKHRLAPIAFIVVVAVIAIATEDSPVMRAVIALAVLVVVMIMLWA